MPVTSKSGPPIITSRWIVARFRPRVPCGARAAEAGAERDVRRRVLVEQRVEVRAPALADARRRVDERDLAEPAAVAVRVAVDVRRDEVAVRRRRSASSRTSLPFENSPRRPSISLPWNVSGNVHANVPFVPVACGLVNDSSVGMFGAIFTPAAVSSWPPSQRAPGVSFTSSCGAGAAQLEPREAELRQLRRAPRDRLHVVRASRSSRCRPSSVSRQNQRKSCASLRLPSSGASSG